MIDRASNDNTGSGRTEIWAMKFNDWIENPINLLGCGYQSVVYEFQPLNIDCHNEFLSIIINYGVIGIIITLIAIISLANIKKEKSFIWSFLYFIGIAFMTLSPFTCQTGWTAVPLLMVVLFKYISLNSKIISN